MPVSTTTNTINGHSPLGTNIVNENHENIDPEAPPSAGLDLEHRLKMTEDLVQHARFSIDLSLELESELNMESPPASSSHDVTHAVNVATLPNEEDYSKPDPDVLAHIVTHMRKSLVDLTKERDELLRMLAKENTQNTDTKDALQLMTEKATNVGEELDIARKKMKEDEEQIGLLRAKVEESRRGLMRLQTESKRQSMISTDSRTSSLTLPGFGSSPSSKRASFTPLTGRSGHKRISSVSDPSSFPDLTPSLRTQASNITSPEPHVSCPPPNPRLSGMFGQLLLPTSDLPTTTATESPQVLDSNPSASVVAVDSDELEALRKELQSVKAELVTVKHNLTEAIEAKEASETCVKALREFIADNNVGVVAADGASAVPMKLPPPPTMTTGEEGLDRAKPSGGWGFKLWGVDSSSMPSSASVAAPSPSSPVNSISSPLIAATPLSRKLGGFFSSRSSLSSNSSHQQPISPLQTNAAGVQLPLHGQCQRNSSYSFSDTSSVAEPISPGSDIHGLGTKPAGYFPEAQEGYETMVVKDVTNLNHVHTHALSIQDKDGIVRYNPPMTLSSSGSVDLDGLR